MRKITDHIKKLSIPNKISETKPKVLRSSAIFPCSTNKFLDTKILFMGYWMIKKNIKKQKDNIFFDIRSSICT